MPLPHKVDSLDKVPEAARALYEKKGDAFVLPVQVDGVEDLDSLASAFERTKRERNEFRDRASRVKDEDLTELEALRKEKREAQERQDREAGNWQELKKRLDKEHADALAPLATERDNLKRVVEDLVVTNSLRAAIAEAGIQTQYQEAAEAMLARRSPKVVWEDGKPKGVFHDELHGDQPITEYVGRWAKTDAAKPFLPVKTKPGGGAPGTDGAPGDQSEFAGKEYKDLTPEQKVAFTEQKYGATAGKA